MFVPTRHDSGAETLVVSDTSNGYDAIAAEFIGGRGDVKTRGIAVGVRAVQAWAKTLKPGSAVLDLGCGPGDPITHVLVDAGLAVYGVDASPRMVAAFRERFPGVPVECNTVEESNFFGRQFDGVIAWGLVFLLEPRVQAQLIGKIAHALVPDGRFLFTAPPQACEWRDAMTGQRSESLGAVAYRRLLGEAGLVVINETDDEGDNHYYMSLKPSTHMTS